MHRKAEDVSEDACDREFRIPTRTNQDKSGPKQSAVIHALQWHCSGHPAAVAFF